MTSTALGVRRQRPAARAPAQDQRVLLHGIDWSQYELLLGIRGDDAGVRVAYLNGELELMAPSPDHERVERTLGRLVETFAQERGIELTSFGSWTVRKAARARGVEPDECFVLGEERGPRPDLAIEVILTSGGLDKLEVYRGLGVPEVWIWQDGQLEVWVLRGERYRRARKSALLPELDLGWVRELLECKSQTAAVRELLRRLRGG